MMGTPGIFRTLFLTPLSHDATI